MVGHAVSNVVPVVAANRVGQEAQQIFYGHSFISDQRGNIVVELNDKDRGIVTAEFDFEVVRRQRAAFGLFRDRRPELYGRLTPEESAP
jgi:N-carbamoylputrescine amidase